MAANYSPRRCVTAASRCLLWLIRRPLILRGCEGILVLMWNYWANILPTVPNTALTYLLIYLVISHAIHRCHFVPLLVTNTQLGSLQSVRAKDITWYIRVARTYSVEVSRANFAVPETFILRLRYNDNLIFTFGD